MFVVIIVVVIIIISGVLGAQMEVWRGGPKFPGLGNTATCWILILIQPLAFWLIFASRSPSLGFKESHSSKYPY